MNVSVRYELGWMERHVDHLRGKGGGVDISEDSTGRQKRLCAYQAARLSTWMEFLREPPKATLAIVCSVTRVPWEWEVSAGWYLLESSPPLIVAFDSLEIALHRRSSGGTMIMKGRTLKF
jgi:hypothetical protein